MSSAQYFSTTKGEAALYNEAVPTYTENTARRSEIIFNISEREEIILLSEHSLEKIWMTQAEDEAWKDL
jgi:hypothetical protein